MDGFYYDLEAFGNELRDIRKSLRLTQKDVADQTLVSTDTLRRIENGKVMPKQETLDLMSVIFKRDLNELLLKYRLKDYSSFYKIKTSIEDKLEGGEFEDLKKDVEELKKIIDEGKMSLYYIRLLKQLLLLVESVIEKTVNNDYEKALEKLIEAMKLTIPDFSLSNYTRFVYSSMEVRILMNIALIVREKESEKSIEMLLFCLEALEPDNVEERVRVYYNLSYAYYLASIYDKALYYAEQGIKTCAENKTLNGLALLYFRKGIAEFKLNRENYMDSLLKAVNLSKICGHEKLKKMVIESCKKIYNIDLENFQKL
ncbi:transcriptional regulator with XRE-family HTH domain [Caldanaerobacter subterraneus subsp. tengcongensis MB4]|jgi:transcriptional regulator with XRE-family HTH domain|nr:helix-turn-helix transcriptional regulator [Caldanaerobacter subterraneus]MCS3914887.1 transcriptional regulator with XRE-family HTH domain [Caldanaerobacter subterraneus subsp. tengcongensis MB4]